MLDDLMKKAAALQASGTFLGGPRKVFTRVGRNQLIVLLDQGLTPDCKVLDIGCGCLRGGYWLIHFLESGGYHGIEPNEAMRESGVDAFLSRELVSDKKPAFSADANFDFGVFGVKFDFMIARSVWTHAAPGQIETMLDGFNDHAAPHGVFVTSYLEAGDGEQYSGTEWVGKSHVSKTSGLVQYGFSWIERVCAGRGLAVQSLYEDSGQIWIKVFRRGEHRDRLRAEQPGSHIIGFSAREGGPQEG